MSNNRTTITKLLADGSNWVICRDCMLWAVDSRGLKDHITSASITQPYTNTSQVSHLEAQQHWDIDQSDVKQLIAVLVPNSVFNSIITGTTAKDVWDELKKLYEGCTTFIFVDLGWQISTTHCAEKDSVHDHFNYLSDLHEQLSAMGKSCLTPSSFQSLWVRFLHFIYPS